MGKVTSQYPIFTNKKNGKRLVYYSCPKNANTSAKLFFAKHLGIENKFRFTEDDIPRYLHKKSMLEENKINLINFIPNYQKFQKINAEEKCCIIRDPIKRFISAYKNRILFHRDQDFYNHSVDMVIEKLENKMFENKHFLPQKYFLGKNLEYFTIKANIENIQTFVDDVNNFFGKKEFFPKIQISKSNIKLELTVPQVKKIKKIYMDDFELINYK